MSTTTALRLEAPWFGAEADQWLRHVLDIHFHPVDGTPYWLRRQAELGIDVRRHIRSVEDLWRLGPMDEAALADRPVADFVPRRFHGCQPEWVVGETAGTTGRPKATAYLQAEFEAVFVDFFVEVATRVGFPRGARWLWAGPSGPHIIGKVVAPIARRLGGLEPFSVDFDPRWARKLLPGSLAGRRYLDHVVAQCLDLFRREPIEVLFSTPPVLMALAERLSSAQREAIGGVHYAGLPVTPQALRYLQDEAFPNAVHIAGYGNTLVGVSLEVEVGPRSHLDYFPPGPRVHLFPVASDPGLKPEEALRRPLERGQRGRVVCHRLDESGLIVNLLERDEATRIGPSAAARELGLGQEGLRDPGPAAQPSPPAASGLY